MNDTVDAVSIAWALCNMTRARILALLSRRDLCVCELTDALGQSKVNVSERLRQLVSSGLVTSYRHSYWTHYTLARTMPPDAAHFLDLVIQQATVEHPGDMSALERLPADVCTSKHSRR